MAEQSIAKAVPPQPTLDPRHSHVSTQGQAPLVQAGTQSIGEQQPKLNASEEARAVLPRQDLYERLSTTPEKIAEFCQKWQIIELSLFGSVLKDDFRWDGEDPSDIDILYVFSEHSNHGLFDVMNIREELEHLCQRKIDFISKNAIQHSRNWLRRQAILDSGVVLYERR